MLIPEGGEKAERVSEGEHVCVQRGSTPCRGTGEASLCWASALNSDLSLSTATELHHHTCTAPSAANPACAPDWDCLGHSKTLEWSRCDVPASERAGLPRAALDVSCPVLTCRVVAKGRWLPVVVAGWLPLGEKRG